MLDIDAAEPFPVLLRSQIRRVFTAAQQYLAAAVYFDSKRLPQLAKHCYGRSVEQRAHAMRMVQYLLDRDLDVQVGGLDEVRSTFESPRAAVVFLLETEETRREQVTELARVARESGDYLGERFVKWFLEEQVKDVAAMTTLLAVLDRAAGDLFDVEEFIARDLQVRQRPDNKGPKMAGAVPN